MDSCIISNSTELKQTTAKNQQYRRLHQQQQQQFEHQKQQQQQIKQLQQLDKISRNSIYLTLICLLVTIVAIDADSNPASSAKSYSYHHDSSNGNNLNNNNNNNQQKQQEQQQSKVALDELNSIVQQHDASEGNNKLLAEAIISRLMVDNLTGSNLLQNSGDLDGEFSSNDEEGSSLLQSEEANQAALIEQQQQQQNSASNQYVGPTGPEAMRLKKLLSFLQNYENNMAVNGNGYATTASMFNPFPLLPSGQGTTMKRAAMKMGAYLQPQRNFNSASYPRNQFDFGLGKRPDSSISSNILRLGDSMSSAGAPIQPLNSFGKRPSAHRFDFGLGKRVASVSILLRQTKVFKLGKFE